MWQSYSVELLNYWGAKMNIDKAIDDLIKIEGGYVNNPKDRGGETNFGITVQTARDHGYKGAMRDLPLSVAKAIYLKTYWTGPRFDQVAKISPGIAEELFDTGVNCGVGFAKPLLQRVLNLLNQQQKVYKDLTVDGVYGPKTLQALELTLSKRGRDGELVILRMLNSLQGARYIDLAEKRESQEEFIFGWFRARVVMP